LEGLAAVSSVPLTRRFDLDTPIAVGPFAEHSVDGATLFIDPERGSWLTLEEADAAVFRRLSAGATMRSLLAGQSEQSRERLSVLMTRVVSAGLLGDRVNFADQTKRTQVQIHLTNRCNLRCVHCYMDSGVRVMPETETERWCALIDALADRYKYVFCSFSGGEPLMSSSLFPLLEKAKTRGVRCAIITNGLLLTPRTVRRLDGLLDVCAISLDGISSETHDAIRGRGTFTRTMTRLRQLEGASFRKVINLTVLRSNRDELVAYLHRFINDLPFHVDVDLGSLVQEGRGVQHPDLALSPVEFSEFLLEVGRRFVEDQLAGTRLVGTDGNVLWKSVPSRARLSCGYGNSLVFYSDGGMSPCLTPRFIRGNVFADDPGVLLDRVERERAAAAVDRLEECRTCDLRHICGGRCHLPQLRAGQAPSQVACPDSYKASMYRNLARWRSSA